MNGKIVATAKNRAGADVEVFEEYGPDHLSWRCTGCTSSSVGGAQREVIIADAQEHAAKCSFTSPA